MGQELAQTLDFQVQSQGIKFSQFGIETKTYAYVSSASRATSKDTYEALTKILPIRTDYTVGFVGYQAQNYAAIQDVEGVNQYYIQQKWLSTTLRTKLMSGFMDIDTKIVLKGESTTFCHFMMGAIDTTGNCLLCDADYTSMGVPIIIYPTAHEVLALQQAQEFNNLILQEFQGVAPPAYLMKQVLNGGAQTVEEKKQVNALLTRFKRTTMPKVAKGLQTQFEVTTKVTIPMKQTIEKHFVNSSEVTAATDVTDQLTLETSDQSNVLETLQRELKTQIESTD